MNRLENALERAACRKLMMNFNALWRHRAMGSQSNASQRLLLIWQRRVIIVQMITLPHGS